MWMYTRGCIQDMSSNEPVLVKIFEVVERWVTVDVWVRDSSDYWHIRRVVPVLSKLVKFFLNTC